MTWEYLGHRPPTYHHPSGAEVVLVSCHPLTGPEWRCRLRPGGALSERVWRTLEDAQAGAMGEKTVAAEIARLAKRERERLARQAERSREGPTARMLAAPADGEARTTSDLAHAVGLPVNSASALLGRLIPRRQVERLGRGLWRRVA